MTTIAWDGKTLAADRQVTYGNVRAMGRKLFDCGDFFYAASGSSSEADLVAEWLRKGAPIDVPVRREDDESRVGIVVRKSDGAVFVAQGKTVSLVEHRHGPAAAGSGCDFALAAMALGKTAVQAVTFASRFDLFTGLGVDSVRIQPKRKR